MGYKSCAIFPIESPCSVDFLSPRVASDGLPYGLRWSQMVSGLGTGTRPRGGTLRVHKRQLRWLLDEGADPHQSRT